MAEMHDLRPYQVEAIAEIERAWERGERATLLVLATGLGKTTCFTEIIRRDYARTRKRSLVLAHRIELIDQAAARLAYHHVPCEIESGSAKASPLGCAYDSQAVVATVQTMRGKRLDRWPVDAFSTIIVDEAHRAAGATYREILDRFSGARVLGVTATPDRGDGVALGEVFASICYERGIRAGILDGYLCDLRAKTIDLDRVTIDGVRSSRQEHGRDLRPDDLAKAMAGDECMHAMAAPIAREAGDRSTLIFVPSVEIAHELGRVLAGYVGADKVRSLDGSSDKDDRRFALDAYQRGEVQFLVNCALFTEGFDAPRTSCVVVARPTKSRALYAQMVGRGTRLFPGKSDCLVLDLYPANTRHDLARTVDIYEGDPLPDDQARYRDDRMREGATVLAATEQARQWAREAEEKRQRERERAKTAARVDYEARSRDLWSVDRACGVTPQMYGAPPVREDQRQRMERMRIEIDARETVATASAKIKAVSRRISEGLCTLKQSKILASKGLYPDLPMPAARAAMDALAANRWQVTPGMRARWGRSPAEMERDAISASLRGRP